MIHLDRNPSDIEQNQKSNLILSDDHPSSTAAHFHWDHIPHEHDNNDTNTDYAALANDILANPQDTLHSTLDFSIGKHSPPSSQQPPLDGVHEDKSSPLSPAPDSASPNHDSKDLPHGHPPLREDPPAFDKGDLDVPREGTLTPLTELSPAPELDDDTDRKDEDESRTGETSHLRANTVEKDDKGKGDPPRAKIINGVSSSSSSRSGDGSPVRLHPTTPSAYQNFTMDPVSSRMAEKGYMFAGPSHSRASSSEFTTPPIMHTPHNMPPPNMPHSSNNAKVIRILELNAELFNVCVEFQHRGVQITDLRFQQYCKRLHTNITWLAAASEQRQHNAQVPLPIMEPPVAVEFSPPRIQHLYSDLPTLFAKDIAHRQMLNAAANSHPHLQSHPNHPNQQASPNGTLKRNRPDDLSDSSATKRRDMGNGKMHGSSTSSAAVSPNPMLSGGMPSMAVSGPGHGPGPGSSLHPGSNLGSSLGGGANVGSVLRASPPNTFTGPTSIGGPRTPVLSQSPPIPPVSSSGMIHPSSTSLSSTGGAGIPGVGGVGGMLGMPGTAGPGGAIPGSASGVHPNLPFGASEASIAANSRARVREMQIQQARDQQLRQHQQAAQMQQIQAGARYLSSTPASTQGLHGQGMSGMGGGMSGSNMGGVVGGMGGGNAGGPAANANIAKPTTPFDAGYNATDSKFLSVAPTAAVAEATYVPAMDGTTTATATATAEFSDGSDATKSGHGRYPFQRHDVEWKWK
ncbi:hypothetical protein V8B97DRAFT_168886 [Scleroderma yunnanense]